MQVFEPAKFGVKLELRYTRWGWMVLPVNDMWTGKSLRMYGEYSPMECRLLRQMVQPGWSVVEGGVQIGAVALPIIHKIGGAGSYVGFEPQPIFRMLAKINLDMNGWGDAHVMHAGLGEFAGEMRIPPILYDHEANYGGFDMKEYNRLYPDVGERVPIVTLDGLGLERLDFIKLDVEGMELDVLKGGVNTIEKFKPFMSLECDRKETGPALIRYLKSIGYIPYWMITALYEKDNLYGNPVNKYLEVGTDAIMCSVNIACTHKSRDEEFPLKGLRVADENDEMSSAPPEWIITGFSTIDA